MRLGVIGAGAMGTTLAAEAAAAGHDVVVVDVAPALLEAITRNGVIVDQRPNGQLVQHVVAVSDPADVEPVDIAVVFVKAHHTSAAAATAAKLIGEQGVVATLQNGWGNADVLAKTIPGSRLLIGVTYHSCTAVGPGHALHAGRGATTIGPYEQDGDLESASGLRDLLQSAGWDADVTSRVRTAIWRKLILNSATLPTSALTGLCAGEVAKPSELLDLVDQLARETTLVAQALGHDIDVDERIAAIHQVLTSGGKGKASMLQDVENRRKTEIETVNAAVVAQADGLGVSVPFNRAMVALVHGVERGWAA